MIKANGQNPTINAANNQLRQLFVNLQKPSSNYNFLYDMSVHFADDRFFMRNNNTDTNQTDIWYRAYEEMYHAAYDTSTLVLPGDVFGSGNQFFPDTIPIGIINFSFYKLKSDALTTNNYFNFDTINNILTDIVGRPNSPYNEEGIFIAAPMVSSSHARNVVFKIDPQFIYYDNDNSHYFNSTESEIKIDFGDGNGWISFSPSIVTNYNVTYAAAATYIIKTAIFSGTTIIQSSQSRIIVPSNIIIPTADENIYVPGLYTSVFHGCHNEGLVQKIVIYIAGYNPFDQVPKIQPTINWVFNSSQRKPEEVYQSMLSSDNIIQLKNEGYDFVVTTFKHSAIDMRFNALYIVNLIEELKCRYLSSTHNQQFVVIGESLGGVVARYALTYMESEFYASNNTAPFFVEDNDINSNFYLITHPDIYNLPANRCFTEKMHNTRLFMTFDSPHQGANVPLSVQLAYSTVLNAFGPFMGMEVSNKLEALNLGLQAKATKQLLLYHIDTKSGSNTYTEHPNKTSFYNDLRSLGNYPHFAKVVALSNGSLNGQGQINGYTGNLRVAGDNLLDANLNIYCKILGYKIPMFQGNIALHTNPNGNANVFNANVGVFLPYIKLKWFGVDIGWSYNILESRSEDVQNVLPFCVNAGGYLGDIPQNIATDNDGHNVSDNDLFNVFAWHTHDDGAGWHTLNLRSHAGWCGIVTANLDYQFCTNGFNFCFIPMQSALDYDHIGNLSLNHNIETETINTKLSRVPASVIIGYSGSGVRNGLSPSFTTYNYPHLNFRNDNIFNITRHPTTSSLSDFIYLSCVSNEQRVNRAMLNLEIGDEELYLENNTLPWYSDYQAEYAIHINQRNPLYEYPHQPFVSSSDMLRGVYSKENSFTITNTGFANFICDRNAPPLGIGGLFMGSPVLENYYWSLQDDVPQFSCCHNYIGQRSILKNLLTVKNSSYVKLSPNPLIIGTMPMLQYKFMQAGIATLKLINGNGQQVLQQQLYIPQANQEFKTRLNLFGKALPTGLYYVELSNGKTIANNKIIITIN